jgi:hypothetical protein
LRTAAASLKSQAVLILTCLCKASAQSRGDQTSTNTVNGSVFGPSAKYSLNIRGRSYREMRRSFASNSGTVQGGCSPVS